MTIWAISEFGTKKKRYLESMIFPNIAQSPLIFYKITEELKVTRMCLVTLTHEAFASRSVPPRFKRMHADIITSHFPP